MAGCFFRPLSPGAVLFLDALQREGSRKTTIQEGEEGGTELSGSESAAGNKVAFLSWS